jgi:hypothetical protein
MSQPIVHHNLALLEVADPKVLDELRALLPLEDYVLGQLSDTELIVDPRRVRELVERLESRGLAPLVKKG